MIAESHPLWVDRIVYWNVRDLPFLRPDVALPKIEREVFLLLAALSGCREEAGLPAARAVTDDTIQHVAPNFTKSSHNCDPFDKET